MRSFLALLFVLAFVAPSLCAADALPTPLDPRGLPGPIVIAGGQTTPADARKAFFDLAGKDKAKIVVVLAPAKMLADTKSIVAPWIEMKPLSAEVLYTKNRKEADDPKFVNPLTDATAVWLEGANATHFKDTYRGTLLEKELQKLHARGGVIGGGSSGVVLNELGLLPGFKMPAPEGFIAKNPAY